ncbi:MAG: helix-turn-helix domain-containing protein [Planctomycetota bacterium]|jgi:hypothetical protein
MHIGMQIVEAVARESESVAVATLKRVTALPHATITRNLKTLCEEGYLRKVERGRYALGQRTLSLANSAINHGLQVDFIPLLDRLAAATGLNAELFDLAQDGPFFMAHRNGGSLFTPRMHPGFHLEHFHNQVVAFHHLHHGLTRSMKGCRPKEKALWKRYLEEAAKDSFVYEEGNIRPELARAVIQVPDTQYCIGISGLMSEFSLKPKGLKTLLHREIKKYLTR